ncbi:MULTISPECIES: DUF4349 domain-containing protein [unclassified Janthinobacterium]|uniref:DUF4349 domain-containing protein n=1 Tax=unclassified Janthinobacterium TaxID=2610881 RepID=UPI00034CE043|nr:MULTISPECIES: DUF4349 domain-containing protein [unclassified Janthinobacterium]MEC5163829.1 hypothetical protein [Janthinobacterium sp. CG_S6]
MMDLKNRTRAAGYITLMVLLASCAKKEEAPSAAPAVEGKMQESARPAAGLSARAAPAAPEKAVTAATTSQQIGSSAATYADSERQFIRTASARFRVKDVYVAALGIEDTVGSHGGFVVKNDISAESVGTLSYPIGNGKLMELSEHTVQGHLIVRVPSAKTQEFLHAIVGHIMFLDQRSFSARDAQLDLLRQQLDMMRNQETQSELGQAVKDGGKLVQKTDAIATRNDVKAARDAAHIAKKEFEDQVAFSTIDVTLYQPSKVLQTERVDVSSLYRQFGPGFFNQLGERLRGGWEGLLELLLALAGIWPVLLVVGALGPMLWRVKRRQRKAAVASE